MTVIPPVCMKTKILLYTHRQGHTFGATVNQFVLQAALKEADRVIEHERVIMPSARDARMILQSLDHPSPPNARLRAALKRYKEAFGGASTRTAG